MILGHEPAGASTKTIVHYAQEIKSGKYTGTRYLHALDKVADEALPLKIMYIA